MKKKWKKAGLFGFSVVEYTHNKINNITNAKNDKSNWERKNPYHHQNNQKKILTFAKACVNLRYEKQKIQNPKTSVASPFHQGSSSQGQIQVQPQAQTPQGVGLK